MSIISELEWRGLIQDISNQEQVEQLPAGTPFYAGFDPTAPSLQIGNLVPLFSLIHLGRAGLQPIVLFGGATGAIGDPSGKNEERNLLDRAVLEKNVQTQMEQTRKILASFNLEARFVNNIDWTAPVSFLDFLRDVGKYLTVNYMIAKEVVSARLSTSGISYTEFSYMLLQAHDFLHLYQEYGCKLQIGGSDQWGNITAGLELIRKKIQGDACAFSLPLITDSSGKKFGKSEGSAVWLDPNMTSPYKLHQFFLNVPDNDVVRLLKVFTFLSKTEIEELEKEAQEKPEQRAAQKALADSIVTLIHGSEEAERATASAKILFGGSFDGFTDGALQDIFADVPSSEFSREILANMSLLDIFIDTGLVQSRGDGKKLFKNGGAYLNNKRAESFERTLSEVGALDRKLFVLRSGKKSYHVVRIT